MENDLNARLFVQTADAILVDEDAFDQFNFGAFDGDYQYSTDGFFPCYAPCCVAGWMYWLSHPIYAEDDDVWSPDIGEGDVSHGARQASGMTFRQANKLFNQHWPNHWFKAMAEGQPLCPAFDAPPTAHFPRKWFVPGPKTASDILRHIAQYVFSE